MRSVTLLRHAKAVEAVPGQDDHERPLAPRGRRAARAVGEATASAPPDLVLCSTALRTRETWEEVAKAWPAVPPVRFERDLYQADPSTLLARLEALETAVRSVWIIGHNPALHELARWLAARAAGGGDYPTLAQRFPTAARIRFESRASDWAAFARAPLAVAAFVIPT